MTEESRSPQDAPQTSEQRKSVRLQINAVTEYTAAGKSSSGLTRLINLGGLLMEVNEALALGSKLELSLQLPMQTVFFKAKGEVVFKHDVRNRKSHGANEIGIKFVHVEQESELLLKDFTQKYHEFNPNHSIYSKEMSSFADPTILKVDSSPKKSRS